MQCAQVQPDGSVLIVPPADGSVCSGGLYLVEAADNAWAALLLDPTPWQADMSMAFGVGITLPLGAYVAAWAFGTLLGMFARDKT
ncbi:MAG: hypothetical protein ACRCXB_32420 [Aeromonadaceae bacterium]